MFNMYRRQFYRRSRLHGGSEEELGHDRFNYKDPNVNYDKWPRRLRPKKNSLKVELEAPESPHMPEPDGAARCFAGADVPQRHCHGSLREHQRLLSIRSARHKCSPRCRVKSQKTPSQNLSAEALVKVFACLGVQDGQAVGNANSAAVPAGTCDAEHDKHKGCQHKRPKRLSVFSVSLPSIRHSSRAKDYSHTNGSAGGFSILNGSPGDGSGSGAGACGSIELCEMEKKLPRSSNDVREMATDICRQYIRSSTRYHLLDHLPDIGSRIDKQWFMIRDATLKTDRLLTIVPLMGSTAYGCEVPSTDADVTRNALVDLFTALQHPYIYPVLDLDFVYGAVATSSVTYTDEAKPVLVTVFPFNSKGSLKDLIYRSRWQDDWGQKYRQRSDGLPLLQVQRLGRQILEALLFLQEKGFPPFGHLHSGNVIIQNGVARLTGYENTLLGFSSRIHPLVKSILPTANPTAVDSICFGHILFEMCSGYELYAPKPTARHLEDLQAYPQVVEVLDYIFNAPADNYPSVGELAALEFFRNIDLREMRCSTIYYNAKFTAAAINLLEQVQTKQRRPENCVHHKVLQYHQRVSHTQQRQKQKLRVTLDLNDSEPVHPGSPQSTRRADVAAEDESSNQLRRKQQPGQPRGQNQRVTRTVGALNGRNKRDEAVNSPADEQGGEPAESPQSPSSPVPPESSTAAPISGPFLNHQVHHNIHRGTGLCCLGPESTRSFLTLHLSNGGVNEGEVGVVRKKSGMSTSCTSPSLNMLASLLSIEKVRRTQQESDLDVTPTATPAQMNCSFCSEDSFQTPLESPCVEWEYYNNQPFMSTSSPDDGSATPTPTGHVTAGQDHRPKLVLTPPDVHEAFSIEESLLCP